MRALDIALWVTLLSTEARAQTLQDWQADIDSLIAGMERRHPNLYHTVPRDSLATSLRALTSGGTAPERHRMIFEVARVLARIGDGHTGLFPPFDTDLRQSRYPIEVFDAADGVVITGIDSAHRQLLGTRVIRVGRTPIAQFREGLVAFIPRDNANTPRSLLPHYFSLSATHAVLGTASAGPLAISAVDSLGRVHDATLAVNAGSSGALIRLHDIVGAEWLARRDRMYWMKYDAAARTLFLQYNRADTEDAAEPLLQFAERLVSFVDSVRPGRIVVDLRWNSGGASWWSNMLLNALIRAEPLVAAPRGRNRQPHGRMFVLIGPSTFSQGTNFALDLEAHTNATFVGSGTGGRPNVYSGPGRVTLPRTGIRVRVSNGYSQGGTPVDQRMALEPDIQADITWADVRKGVDPALRAIEMRAQKQR